MRNDACFTLGLSSALVFLIVGFLPLSTLAVDVDEVKELNCIRPQPDVARNVDYRWMLSIDRWHIPLQSKLNYYRLAETLLETPIADLTESDLAINASCLTYKWDNTHPKLFGGMDADGNERVADYFATPVYENSFGIKGFWAKAKRARSYVTLKDNKSFVVFVICWEDEESSWQVISTEARLDEEAKNEIIDHVNNWDSNKKILMTQTVRTLNNLSI